MTKVLYSLIFVLMFVGCKQQNEHHAMNILHPASGYNIHYADQTSDSITFLTFDSYRATTEAEWLQLDPMKAKGNISNSYYNMVGISIPFSLSPNSTGKSRMAIVNIRNYGQDWDQHVQVGCIQLGWLNIYRPEPKSDTESSIPSIVSFNLVDSAYTLQDSLRFYVEKEWSIELFDEQQFVTPNRISGDAGDNMVRLTLKENESTQERRAKVVLHSSGVSNEINIIQLGKKGE